MEKSTYNTSKKEIAEIMISVYNMGAISCASAHLGFDIDADKLTKVQAKKFHKFVTPLLEKACKRLEGNEEKMNELEKVYTNTMPSELLAYLLKEESLH